MAGRENKAKNPENIYPVFKSNLHITGFSFVAGMTALSPSLSLCMTSSSSAVDTQKVHEEVEYKENFKGGKIINVKYPGSHHLCHLCDGKLHR